MSDLPKFSEKYWLPTRFDSLIYVRKIGKDATSVIKSFLGTTEIKRISNLLSHELREYPKSPVYNKHHDDDFTLIKEEDA